MPSLNEDLTQFLKSQGASLVGFAELQEIDSKVRDGLPFGISIALALNPRIMSGIKKGPTRAYYDEYKRVNARLDKISQKTAQCLTEKGFQAVANTATYGEDKATLSTRLPHKTVATRAGLGWIGKCALLVTKRFGSAVRLTSVLTDAPLTPGRPLNNSLCSHCTHCFEACPAHAITGESWQAGMPREDLYDAFKCRDTAEALSLKGFGIKYAICGLCIVACPWTKKYLERAG
jgi:epoxyqueuosine reductase